MTFLENKMIFIKKSIIVFHLLQQLSKHNNSYSLAIYGKKNRSEEASNLLNNDYHSFWTEVKKLNSSNAIISNLIDGSSESNITNLWKKHFYNILNENTCDSDLRNEVMAKLENIQHTDDMTVSCIDISNLISQLKCGKAAGSDDLCAEYFKFAHSKLHILLSMCFTLFFTHSYLPAPMIETIIVPIVKNKVETCVTAITTDQLHLLP